MKREICFISIENIVDYWQRFWVDRVDKLLKAEKYDDIAKSPRLLLNNMLSEIKYNGFKNDNNWNLFRQQLEKWRKNELVFKNLFNNECGIILANWRHELCINQCNSIVAKMNSGVYYEAVIKKLIKCLRFSNDFSVKNKDKIQIYSDIIIIELLHKGYVLEDIASFIYHPDVRMTDMHTVVIAPNEFNGYKMSDYNSIDEYHDVLTTYFKNLSIDEKVSIINLYYNKQAVDVMVLIRLIGIKGDVDIFIDDINIYSLGKKNFIDEKFSAHLGNQETVYAAIPVRHKRSGSSISYAVSKLKSILSLLQLKLGLDTISFSVTIQPNQ